MDNFCEQLVEKRRTKSDFGKVAALSMLLALGASASVFFAFYTGWMILLLLAVGLVVLAFWFIMGMNVEYEYIVTNNELDIDKIVGRRTRKRMITVELDKTEDFGTYPPETEIDAETTVHATTGLELNAHYLVVKHKDYGKVKIIFNPNEKLREAIAQEFPRSLSAKLRQYGK